MVKGTLILNGIDYSNGGGIGGEGGTSDYTRLSNKPKINGVTINGNVSLAGLGVMPAGTTIPHADGTTITQSEDGTLTAIIEATTDYEELDNKPKINGKELSGDVSLSDIGAMADTKVIPYADGTTITQASDGKLVAVKQGTDVEVTSLIPEGTDIAVIKVDGTSHYIKAPEGGGSDVEVEPAFNEGTKIATITVNEEDNDIFIPEVICTQEEYDALPDTKYSDNVNYYIVEGGTASSSTKSNGVIGEVIAYMGTAAPDKFLVCDGSVYAISSYPSLARHIKDNFGSFDYFGGDGETTFAVPDLRGEFLRGSGENGHENCGNGANVGVHQKATSSPIIVGTGSANNYMLQSMQRVNNWSSYAYPDKVYYDDTTQWINFNYSGKGTDSQKEYAYASRPTNTSVLYCIRYAKDNSSELSYSTEEQFTGKLWLDGSKLYQKTYYFDSPGLTASNTWAVLLTKEDLDELNINYTNPITTDYVSNYNGLVWINHSAYRNSAATGLAIHVDTPDNPNGERVLILCNGSGYTSYNYPLYVTFVYTKKEE